MKAADQNGNNEPQAEHRPSAMKPDPNYLAVPGPASSGIAPSESAPSRPTWL